MTQTQPQRDAGEPGRGLLARFARDTRGGFATMLAVAAIPLIAMAGVGVDVARVLSARTDLQASTDNAALALARAPFSGQTTNSGASGACPGGAPSNSNAAPTSFQTQACNWVLTNFNRSDASNLVVTPTSSASQVAVGGAVDVTTTLSGIIGVRTIHVAVNSVVNRSLTQVELALVLDNTGSMNESDGSGSTKDATLKSAAKTLVDTLSASAIASGQANSFKVAMVPFATYVNIKNLAPNLSPGNPTTYPSWMPGVSAYDNDVFGGAVNRFSLLASLQTGWAGCVESRPMPYDAQDTAPTLGAPKTLFVPYFAPDEPDTTLIYSGNGRTYDAYYNNYLADGAGNVSTKQKMANVLKYVGPLKPAGASGNASIWESTYPTNTRGPNKDCANVPLVPLTTDYASVQNAIAALSPAGNTHIPFGMAWGWYMLSPNMPFGATTAYNTPNLYKIVVLVTDGNNTYNQANDCGGNLRCNDEADKNLKSFQDPNDNNGWYNDGFYTGYGYPWQQRITSSASARLDAGMNTRLSALCANMQTAGVILYTVPLLVTDAPTKAILQTCASPSNVGPQGNKYLEAQTGSDLTAAFSNIAGQISALRIAR